MDPNSSGAASSLDGWANCLPCLPDDWTAKDFAEMFSFVESQDARKAPPSTGYTSKVRVLDRYKVVGFISSGTYGRVYKAVGVNGQSGEFAIKKYVYEKVL